MRTSFVLWTLATIVALAGVWAALFSFGLVATTLVTVPYNDEWVLLHQLAQNNGNLTLADLWASHNEHRVVIARLIGWLDVQWFHGQGWMPIALVYLIQLSQAILLILSAKRAELRGPTFLLAIGLILYCCFAPSQVQNLVWGFQVAFVAAFLFSHLGFRAIAPADKTTVWHVGAALLCGIGASFGIASGLAFGAITTLLLWRFGVRFAFLFSIAWLGFAALYLVGFKAMRGVNPLQELVQHPLQIVQFTVRILQHSLPELLQHRPILVLIPALAAVFWTIWNCWWRREGGERLVWAGLALFCLVNLGMIAVGRVQFGLQQATESRYQTPALLFWICAILLWLPWLQRRSVWLQIVVVIGAIGAFQDRSKGFDQSIRDAKARQVILDTAAVSVAVQRPDPERMIPIGMHSDYIAAATPFLKSRDLAPMNLGTRFGLALLISERFQRGGDCTGGIDEAVPAFSGFRVTGWAYDSSTGEGVRWIVLTDAVDRVIGLARGEHFRGDLNRFRLLRETVGYLGTARSVPVKAFAILERSRLREEVQACELKIKGSN